MSIKSSGPISDYMASLPTKEERLAAINIAIQNVLIGGQSYKIGSRSLTRADLDVLLSERDKIEAEMKAEQSSAFFTGTFVADFGYDNVR